MRLQKIIFLCCILITTALFVEGIYFLRSNDMNIERRIQLKQNREAPNTSKELEPRKEEPVNVLILGLDKEGIRTDVMALLNINPEDGRINVLSIARDTRVYADSSYTKINALNAIGGEELVMQRVAEITTLPVHYYITINLEGFRQIIDTLGGVSFNVPFDMDYDDYSQGLHIHLKRGLQVLNGDKAEQFVRYRKGNRSGEGYTSGDLGRIKAQQNFIKELFKQKLKVKYISKANGLFNILKQYTKTNIEIDDISYYLESIRKLDSDKIDAYTLPGESAYLSGIWYYIYNEEKTRDLVEKRFFK